jgi:hypothetical protein
MFNNLAIQIKNIIDIVAISEQDSVINISYFPNQQPTEQQLIEINNLISNYPVALEKAKSIKLIELEKSWKETISSGWQTSYGWSLGIDIQDITLLNGAFTLAKEAANMGINDPITIVDIDGESHQLPLADFTVLMLQYGQARAYLSNQYAQSKKNIKDATSIEDLQ